MQCISAFQPAHCSVFDCTEESSIMFSLRAVCGECGHWVSTLFTPFSFTPHAHGRQDGHQATSKKLREIPACGHFTLGPFESSQLSNKGTFLITYNFSSGVNFVFYLLWHFLWPYYFPWWQQKSVGRLIVSLIQISFVGFESVYFVTLFLCCILYLNIITLTMLTWVQLSKGVISANPQWVMDGTMGLFRWEDLLVCRWILCSD